MLSDGMTYLIKIDTNGNTILPGLAGNAKKADTSLNKIGATSKRSFSSLSQSAQRSNSILGKTRGLLAGIGLTLTTGVLASGIVGLGANFEKSMSEVKSLTNATAIEMSLMEASARKAGATTEHTALSSSKAMGFLAMAGFDTNQIVSALPGTLSLASAGNLELARSADIATNILTQYRMKASETGVVVDQLAHLQASFNTNISEAAEAMNYIGPKAAAMGISLAETNATIGLLASGGYKGSLATRALGTSLVRLTKPTSEMKAKINELNLKLFDSEGKFVGLAGMVEQLEDRYASLTSQQQLNATATLFGSEAVDKWTVLLNAGSDSIRQYTDDLNNASGAANRMAEIKMDNLAGDFKTLQSATQEVGLQLFEHVGPSLRAATMEATIFIRSLDTREVGLYLNKTVNLLYKGVIWIKNNHRLIIGLGKAYVLLRVGMFAYTKASLIANLADKAGIGLKWAFIAATKSAAVANRALGVSMMMTPWGAIAGAIALATAALGMFAIKAKATKEEVDDLNLDNILKKQQRQENATLLPKTLDDFNKLKAGDLSQLQYSQVISNAKERIKTAQDQILDLKVAVGNTVGGEWAKKKLAQSKDLGLSAGERGKAKAAYDKFMERELSSSAIGLDKGISYNNLKKIIKDNQAQINKASTFINDPALKSGLSGGVVAEGETTSDNVVSGGSKQRIVNVTLENIENNLNFNVADKINEISSSIEELYDLVNNQMVRVFNNANQLAD
ncbi:MAG: phage tail tape measure protein [Marinilabiliaceae bacterium]|nr:phage tail tape measure protein [Marinilabiliaceae bacterium]